MPFRKDKKSTRSYMDKKFVPGSLISRVMPRRLLIFYKIRVRRTTPAIELWQMLSLMPLDVVSRQALLNSPKIFLTSLVSSWLESVILWFLRDVRVREVPWRDLAHFWKMQLIESGDNEKYNLPKDFPIDIAHPLFAGTVHAADCLRELAKDPEQDVELMMCCRGGKIADVPRMVIKDSTLGALLPSDKPAKARKTVILLGIGNAHLKTSFDAS